LSLVALVDLIRRGAGVQPSVLGLSVPVDTQDRLLVAAALGMLAGVAIASGIALLVAARRRRRERVRRREETDIGRLETVRRLLQERVDMLSATVRELEERQAELRDGRPTPLADRRGGAATGTETLLVLPEAPPERDR
jgi:hypothetical protein